MKERHLRKFAAVLMAAFLCTITISDIYGQVASVIVSNGNDSTVIEGIPEISAAGAIVVDMDTGYTLYEKNIYDKQYPASITKIMTAVLAIQNLNIKDMVTFSHDAVYTIEPGSSSGYLREGEQITVEQCLYGLMLISGNDIANGLGEAVSGTTAAFSLKMNEKAKELGCKNTSFVNPHGLHDNNHYTCPYDMALIGKYAYDNVELYRTLISETRYVVEPTEKCDETRYWHNSNRMITLGEEYYDEDCIGGKTGFTNEAGGTLVTYHNINGRTIMIVVMKASNSAWAYMDTKSLCDYINKNVEQTYFAGLDEKYATLMAEQEETPALEVGNQNNQIDKTSSDESSNVDTSEFPLPVKILLFLFLLFVIYYFYISVQRRKRRKRRRNKRRPRYE